MVVPACLRMTERARLIFERSSPGFEATRAGSCWAAFRAASARSIRTPITSETWEIIQVIKAAEAMAHIAVVNAGLTLVQCGSFTLIQPLMSAAPMTMGTKARSRTAWVELPRHARRGQVSGPAAAMKPRPQRKKAQALERATGMNLPP